MRAINNKQDTADVKRVQRNTLSVGQIRGCLHLRADGIAVPETAVVSRQKYSSYLEYLKQVIEARQELSATQTMPKLAGTQQPSKTNLPTPLSLPTKKS